LLATSLQQHQRQYPLFKAATLVQQLPMFLEGLPLWYQPLELLLFLVCLLLVWCLVWSLMQLAARWLWRLLQWQRQQQRRQLMQAVPL
jgi:hypothetical protein